MGIPGVVPDNHSRILEILQKNKNNSCADCGMMLNVDTAWAVLSYGIFVCDDCKLVHIQQENHYKAVDQGAASQTPVTGEFFALNLYQRNLSPSNATMASSTIYGIGLVETYSTGNMSVCPLF